MTVPSRTLSSTPQNHLDDHNGAIRAAANRRMIVHNVLDYGAVGTNDVDNGSAPDATAGIQAAIDAANAVVIETVKQDATNGTGWVFIPGNRDYKITSTLNIPMGIRITGGVGAGNGTHSPPRLLWRGGSGAGTSVMQCQVDNNISNIQGVYLENIEIGGNLVADHCFTFRRVSDQTGGKLDTGTHFVDVRMAGSNSHALNVLVPGMTNFTWVRGRWDQIRGYAIYVKTTANTFLAVTDATYDNRFAANDNDSMGFLFLDNQTAGSNGKSFVSLRSLHLEVNGSLTQTYLPTGWTPTGNDTRGLIRFGVNTTSTAKVQHVLHFENMWVPRDPGAAAMSVFQVTSSDLAGDHRDFHAIAVHIAGINLHGLGSGGGEGAVNTCDLIRGIPTAKLFTGNTNTATTRQVSIMDYRPASSGSQFAPGVEIRLPFTSA